MGEIKRFETAKKKRKDDPNWFPTQSASLKACQKNGQMLAENIYRAEMLAIQKKYQGADIFNIDHDGQLEPQIRRTKKVNLFNRDRFNNYLGSLVKEIYADNHLPQQSKTIYPYAIELMIQEEEYHSLLILKVEWLDGISEVCHLHLFQKDQGLAAPNPIRNFITILVNNPGRPAEVEGEPYAKNGAEYLRRAGISGVLYNLFKIKITSNGTIFPEKRIILVNEPVAVVKKLLKHIQKLKFIRWDIN